MTYQIEQTNIIERVRTGHASFGVRVEGYWSPDVIRIYVRRSIDWSTQKYEWSIEVDHSSGGRDSKQVEDDLDAEENFGNAMIAAVQFARELRSQPLQEEFEAAYQAYQVELQAWHDEQVREKQAKLDVDPALTEQQVEELIEKLITESGSVALVERGSEGNRVTRISAFNGAKLTFYIGRYRTSKKEVIRMLSNASNRTKFVAS